MLTHIFTTINVLAISISMITNRRPVAENDYTNIIFRNKVIIYLVTSTPNEFDFLIQNNSTWQFYLYIDKI